MSSEKFVELVELLLEQQAASETRRESAEREQVELLERILSKLIALTEASTSSVAPSTASSNPSSTPPTTTTRQENAVSKSQEGGKHHSAAWADWEEQKQQLLQEFSDDELGKSECGQGNVPATNVIELPTQSAGPDLQETVKSIQSLDLLERFEHLDANDPALHDEEVRRQLVARLRKIEVDLSLECAQLARQRSTLDQKVTEFEHQQKLMESKEDEPKSHERKVWRMVRFLGGQKE